MTIKDLARLSGYSLGTVSRALNAHPNVSDKARERILSLANEYGYEINTNAQSLKQQNSSTILVIVKGRANELFAHLVEHTQFLAARMDLPLLVDYIDEDDNEVRRAIRLCREKKPQGILFFGGTEDHFRQDFDSVSVPSVLVTNSLTDYDNPKLSWVATDDVLAARDAAEMLTSLGHRAVTVIGGDLTVSEISRKRLQGAQMALAAAGAHLCSYAAARFSYQGGYDAMSTILQGEELPTAVFAMSDVMAIGAIRRIHDHGLRVPEDIAVVGFDGIPLCRYLTPKLATVAQSAALLAEESFSVLQSACKELGPQHIITPHTRCTGESLGPVKKAL